LVIKPPRFAETNTFSDEDFYRTAQRRFFTPFEDHLPQDIDSLSKSSTTSKTESDTTVDFMGIIESNASPCSKASAKYSLEEHRNSKLGLSR
jgi:hypothetical protein